MKFPLQICPTVLPQIPGLHAAIVAKVNDMAATSIFHDWSYYVLPPVKGNNLTLDVSLTIWLDPPQAESLCRFQGNSRNDSLMNSLQKATEAQEQHSTGAMLAVIDYWGIKPEMLKLLRQDKIDAVEKQRSRKQPYLTGDRLQRFLLEPTGQLYHVLKEEEAQFRKGNRGKGHKRGRTE